MAAVSPCMNLIPRRRRTLVTSVLAGGLSATGALASGQTAADPIPAPSPTGPGIELTAGAWLARFGGEVQLGDGGSVFRVDQTIRNDGYEVAPLVECSLLDGEGFSRWRLQAFDFSSDVSGATNDALSFGSVSLAAGDPYEASIDFTSLSVDHVIHRWTAIDPAASDGSGVGRGDARLDWLFLGGLRWIGVDQRIGIPGGASEAPDADWLVAMFGARFEFTWEPPGGFAVGEQLRISAELTAGPGLNAGGGSAWSVRSGAELTLADGVRGYFGYRLLELNLEDGDWTFDSGLQGLFVGLSIAF